MRHPDLDAGPMRQVVEAKMYFELQGKTEKVQAEIPVALRWVLQAVEPTRGYRRPDPRGHLYSSN